MPDAPPAKSPTGRSTKRNNKPRDESTPTHGALFAYQHSDFSVRKCDKAAKVISLGRLITANSSTLGQGMVQE